MTDKPITRERRRERMIAELERQTPKAPETPAVDYDTSKKIRERLGDSFMDMDNIAQTIHGEMPSISTEMLYRHEVDMQSRIYTIFLTIGILLVLAVLLFV